MRSRGGLFIGILLTVSLWIAGIPIAAHAFTTDDVKAVVNAYITQRVKDGGGVFTLRDEMTGTVVALEFVKIRLIRKVTGHGYFAAVDFRVQGEPEKFYDVDIWAKPQGDKLVVLDARVHKYPEKIGNEWVLKSVSPLPWWWAVAQEHPGETAEAKAWEVKAAIHEHVAEKVNEGGGTFKLTDDKTGENLNLEFVKIHDPVMKIPDQGYFACADFRVQGEPEKIYDIDFWVNPKGDTLAVTKTRVHKEPVKEGSTWVKKARYTFEKDKPVEIP